MLGNDVCYAKFYYLVEEIVVGVDSNFAKFIKLKVLL